MHNLQNKNFMTSSEVAKMLKVSISYLAKLRMEKYNKNEDGNFKENYLPYFKFSNKILYDKDDVIEWLNAKLQKKDRQ